MTATTATTGPRTVLVTGVRAKTGLPLATSLAARDDVVVRGGSSDPAGVEVPGVEAVAFSWDDPEPWDAAVRDVDAVYVVRPDRPDAPALIGNLLARTAPGTRVVLLSDLDADLGAADRWSLRVEEVVATSGRPWVALRPGWFSQVLTDPRFFLTAIVEDGELPYPAGDGALSWIDARDVAAVAEVALLDASYDGRLLTLTGPAAYTLPETAALVSAALGRPVAHRDQTVEEAVSASDEFVRALETATFERVRSGAFAVVTDTVAEVTGRSARRFEDYVAEAFSATTENSGSPA
ncbi:NAD(P)H-binding protein [Nocardioides sp. CFH 31398]|uniref:NAD(P)H-binding protein n=1 Tax=Nocardioides sp. CFH 31398 TaxID=2919579 RepID=UPI001F05BE4E|nr:NAD(P)H-binding protein [Nocardioides sp. CFH 31398]MCH1865370.1 NAD(P)H-binding protein [Nocardioides sp. CFH 31398]MCH1868754.1 NAD(P)H-binding protein [Nocardioides sp. CFH 31398]